jgi:magnesium chelatase subunit D
VTPTDTDAHPTPDTPAHFPFSAVVGQDRLKLALILCAVAPEIGGVLIRGEKGTAKSTVVRALAPLLPPHAGRPGRMVELPIGATDDRVVGSLDVQRILTDGETAFTPGLLADADGGVLYIDEVNLLADHLVDLLLDAAAMGRVTVERDAVSRSYPARFVLVGTMNPEEGELRPQLLDRFGLAVAVAASRDVDDRVEVVTRRMDHDADPAAFAERWREADESVAGAIARARRDIGAVVTPRSELRRIAGACTALGVDGLRADIVVARTARAHAAWRGASEVDADDIRVALELAAPHRRRRDPFDDADLSDADLDAALEAGDDAARSTPPETSPPAGGADGLDAPGEQSGDTGATGPSGPAPDGGTDGGGPDDGGPDGGGPDGDGPHDGGPDGTGPGAPGQGPAASTPTDGAPQTSSTRPPARTGPLTVDTASASLRPAVSRTVRVTGVGDGDPGRRSAAWSRRGATVGHREYDGTGVHVTASVLTAVADPSTLHGRTAGDRLRLEPAHLRSPIRIGREGNLVVFCVDLSGSMTARRRLDAVGTACASLLRDSYQRRDRVAVVAARGSDAEVVVPPTRSSYIAGRRLSGARTGGRTPLAEGLLTSLAVVDRARHTDSRRRPLLVVVTDGRATSGADAPRRAWDAAARVRARGVDAVVVDCESGVVRLGLAKALAVHLDATWMPLAEITGDAVTGIVRSAA